MKNFGKIEQKYSVDIGKIIYKYKLYINIAAHSFKYMDKHEA